MYMNIEHSIRGGWWRFSAILRISMRVKSAVDEENRGLLGNDGIKEQMIN